MSAEPSTPSDTPVPYRTTFLTRRRVPTTIERFKLPPFQRLFTFSLVAYSTGATLGVIQGGRQAALRFRAENSHRLPKNQRGWYFYHKSKHAYVALAGLGEAHRMGTRLVPWVALLIAVEELVDSFRLDENFDDTRKDFMSTTVAGVSVAGTFSVWSMLVIRGWPLER